MARRGELLRQLVVFLITCKKFDILAVHMLFELLDCFQVVCLNCKVQRVHQVRTRQLVEIEELQIAIDYLLERDAFILADVLDIGEELTYTICFALVQ